MTSALAFAPLVEIANPLLALGFVKHLPQPQGHPFGVVSIQMEGKFSRPALKGKLNTVALSLEIDRRCNQENFLAHLPCSIHDSPRRTAIGRDDALNGNRCPTYDTVLGKDTHRSAA